MPNDKPRVSILIPTRDLLERLRPCVESILQKTTYSNFELVYNGHILLLDAYYDRGSGYPSLGFKAADIKLQ